MTPPAGWRRGILALCLTVITACETAAPVSSPAPATRPEPQIAAPRAKPGEASRKLSAHYARVESDLRAQGLLRQDGGGPDTPYNARQLTENFLRIALYDEYVSRGGTLVAEQTESRLRRWEQPVRVQVSFGDTVPDTQRRDDRRDIDSYIKRLADVSGHPISTTSGTGNFQVLVLNEDERPTYGDTLRQMVPGIDPTAVRTIENMTEDTFCLVFAFSRGTESAYTRAIAVIRGEHPDLLRLSCIHEEIAQGLGLANDSPRARPSIFNDDEEFGLLTTQDEMMLRMLYDDRLRPGMSVAEARPIAKTIAEELLGGPS
ncbi:MAG: DUF2927 domain-containing protein [Celeribacter sp.]